MSAYNVPIVTGAPLLYEGGYWPIPLGIRIATWSRWTHAGIAWVAEIEGVTRTLVVDAAGGGIDVRPLSQDVRKGYRIAVLDDLCLHDTFGAPERFGAFAWENWQAGTPYDTRAMLHNLLTEIFGASHKPDPPDVPTRYFCSQFVSYALRAFWGFDPLPEYRDAVTTPADLSRSERLAWLTDRLTIEGD